MNGYIELRSNMKKALLKCRLPKHKILATGFCNCLSPETWKERLKNDPSVSSYHERNNHHYGSMEVVNEDDEESDTFDTQSWPEMLPPGKIIHMQETKENNLTMCFSFNYKWCRMKKISFDCLSTSKTSIIVL